jgi:AraC-like DNA-binding protein
MIYKEYLPCPELKDKIECYWKFVIPPTPDGTNTPFTHVFPPEGSCSLIFIKLLNIKQQFLAVVGPSTKVPAIQMFPNSVTFGIRLNPAYSKLLVEEEPAAILNTSRILLTNEIKTWQAQFLDLLCLDFDDPGLLDGILKDNIPSDFFPDIRMVKAINTIIRKKGLLTLKDVADAATLSERQTQRLFAKVTGISVKQFCQIRRLRNALIELYLHKKSVHAISEIGYADSPHFYKSFRSIGDYNLNKFIKYIDAIDHAII